MMGRRIVGFAIVFVLCGAAGAQAAQEFAVQVTGQIQGKFKGEGTRKGFEDKIMGLSFDQEVTSPRDAATGQATGKRGLKPIKIKKAWGAASLQFFAAVAKNELLTVVMDFFSTDPSGLTVLDHTVKLTNAAVASYRSSSDVATPGPQIDTIELVYQTIEITDHRGKGTVTDSLLLP
jgi:type VI secretion system secreted protein Hcp